MTALPLVSIIVPVYNQQFYIQECLQSLSSQTLSNLEIICIDDGSTDASPKLLDDFASQEPRLHVIHQANAGVAHARNVGLKEARGDYILFVDADDFIRVDTCEKLLATALEERADIVVFGGKTFPVSTWADDCFAQRAAVFDGDTIPALLYEAGGNPLMCNKFYRRAFLNEHGIAFNEQLRLGEDNAFQFTAFPAAQRIVFVPDRFYFYRNHAGSAVQAIGNTHDRRVMEHLKIVEYVISVWTERHYLPGYEFDLLDWSVEFLNRDAQYTTLATRKELGARFSHLVTAAFPANTLERLSQERRRQYDFIVESIDVEHEPPLLTIVLAAEPDTLFNEDTFRSIETQTEQHFEILIAGNPSSQSFSPLRDPRARTVPSIAEAIKAARSPWVLVTTPIARYESTGFRQLLDHLGEVQSKSPAVDTVLFTDINGLLPLRDPYECLTINSTTHLDASNIYAAKALNSGAYSLGTVACQNKIFSLELLKQVVDGSSCQGPYSLCVGALSRSAGIHPLHLPIVTLVEPLLEKNGGNALFSEVASLISAAGQHPCSEQRALINALIELPLIVLGTARSPQGAGSLYHAAHHLLHDLCEDPHVETMLDEQPLQCVSNVLSAPNAAEYYFATGFARMELLDRQNAKSLAQVGEFATRSALLQGDINRFYTSVTYRVGKFITGLPRFIVKSFRRAH